MAEMKPMLASPAPAEIKFPVLASPKIDGIRAYSHDLMLFSRSKKPIPNRFIQDTIEKPGLSGLDGELTVGPPNAKDVMQRTTSGVMRQDGEPDFTWWIFDYWTKPEDAYVNRMSALNAYLKTPEFLQNHPRIRFLDQAFVETQEQLDKYEQQCIDQGFEGIMLRSLGGRYKYGRSTAREGYLLKVKRWVDAEARVIGFEERMHNANEATTNELGYTARSSHKDNLIPMNTLGALILQGADGITFNVGTGFGDAMRQHIWNYRDSYLNAIVTYKTFQQTGVKDKPRFNVFKGFRNPLDMS